MKCLRCGKEFKEKNREFCDECGYDFNEGKRLNKILNEKQDPDVPENKQTDLIDYPILSFVFSILGLMIPVMLFSILAIKLSKKPSKANLIPFANVGYVFGILGVAISSLVILILIIWLI
jgi:uncharacterized membrane protein YvbJ